LDKRKIYFWFSYIVVFAVCFFALRAVYYSFVADNKWMDALFVVLLFVIASPLATIISVKVTNSILGPEEK
jgi:hypothetical protein